MSVRSNHPTKEPIDFGVATEAVESLPSITQNLYNETSGAVSLVKRMENIMHRAGFYVGEEDAKINEPEPEPEPTELKWVLRKANETAIKNNQHFASLLDTLEQELIV